MYLIMLSIRNGNDFLELLLNLHFNRMLSNCQNVTQTTYSCLGLASEMCRECRKKICGSAMQFIYLKKFNVKVFFRMECHNKVKSVNQSLSRCTSLLPLTHDFFISSRLLPRHPSLILLLLTLVLNILPGGK